MTDASAPADSNPLDSPAESIARMRNAVERTRARNITHLHRARASMDRLQETIRGQKTQSTEKEETPSWTDPEKD